jgi:hypothetical protein
MVRALVPALTLLSALTVAACTHVDVAASTDGSSGASTDSSGAAATSTTTAGPSGSGTGVGGTDAPTSTTGTTLATDPGADPTTTSGTTSDGSTTTGDTSSGGDSTTGALECTPGQINCDCDGENCEGSAICALGKCLPAGDGSCPSEFDFVCDEPDGCPAGTDPFDCCATQHDGVCEEFDFGGACAPYSDFFDCGYCPFVADGVCNAPDECPAGSDEADCCATQQNGVCEEISQGGQCADGSDPYDCGVCLYEGDGECDVPEYCPDGTDINDCCATQQNGVCEEMSQGGKCVDGSDAYDCGACPYEDDGECDVPDLCPDGTDINDCCATQQNGVCEEMSQGGPCMDGSDAYDCGVCPYEDDNECDVPDYCPEGTDLNDCT